MADGHVVLGGHLAAGAVQHARRDDDGARGLGAGAGEVHGREGGEVVGDGLGFAVGEEEADGAGEVGGEFLEPGGLGFFWGGTEGAGG